MQNNLESLLNDVSEIRTALNDIKAFLMNTKTKPTTKKPLKKAINASLFLNATNKITKQSSKDYLFDFSKIEYNEGSWITFSEFYNACCLDKSVPSNHFSKYFKQTNFYKNNGILNTRMGKKKIIKNIRLRLDISNQQS